MRVISGELKGFRLSSPKGQPLRPTSDRVKEALFQILSPIIQETHFLDLFAGTGNVGIEALSRGASHASFVEEHMRHLGFLRNNIHRCGVKNKTTVYPLNVFKFLKNAGEKEDIFDLIFMDPPYFDGSLYDILIKPELFSILKDNGYVIVEHFHKVKFGNEFPLGYEKVKEYRYGDSILTFLGKKQ